MRESAEMDERVCRVCLKRMKGTDDLRTLLLSDQILCLECRRAMHELSWLKRRRIEKQIKKVFFKEAERRKQKLRLELFILYEENEAFQSSLERYEKLQDTEMAAVFLRDQKKACQFLKPYDLWLSHEEHTLFLSRGWSPLAQILEEEGFSSSLPVSFQDGPELRSTWQPSKKKPGCLVLKNRGSLDSLAALLEVLPVLPQSLFLLSAA